VFLFVFAASKGLYTTSNLFSHATVLALVHSITYLLSLSRSALARSQVNSWFSDVHPRNATVVIQASYDDGVTAAAEARCVRHACLGAPEDSLGTP